MSKEIEDVLKELQGNLREFLCDEAADSYSINVTNHQATRIVLAIENCLSGLSGIDASVEVKRLEQELFHRNKKYDLLKKKYDDISDELREEKYSHLESLKGYFRLSE